MIPNTIRDAASIVGIGETEYWKVDRATTGAFALACTAVMQQRLS